MAIVKVWIDEGCIVCNACEAECADVFHVTDDTCVINGGVRLDGLTSENRAEKAGLKPDLGRSLETQIVAAATGCPVNVIKFEQVAEAAPDEAPAPQAPAVEAPPAAEIPPPAPAPAAPPVAPPVAKARCANDVAWTLFAVSSNVRLEVAAPPVPPLALLLRPPAPPYAPWRRSR